MFTGIVQAMGTVAAIEDRGSDREIRVESAEIAPRLSIGASVALDGACQTVTELDDQSFVVHAIPETLRVTTLGRLSRGSRLNLEAALGAGEPLGGHFVQGHVDGLGRIEGLDRWGESTRMRVSAGRELVAQLVPKASVAIEGVSLTVGPELGPKRFDVFLIPHTCEVTTLGSKKVGDVVNLETDILGKYIWRYLRGSDSSRIDLAALTRAGFSGGGETDPA